MVNSLEVFHKSNCKMKNNCISIIFISKGKNSSKHIDINVNLIRFVLVLFLGLACFSVASFYLYYFTPGTTKINSDSQVHIIPELNQGIQAVTSETEKNEGYEEAFELNFPLFRIKNHKTENAGTGTEVNEKITKKLREVERKLIDMQKLLKKKGIDKKLSIGGHYIPSDRLSDEYLDAVDKDIENLSKIFREYPIGKPIQVLVSSGYGYRIDPFNKKRKAFHSGVDFSTHYGTSVKSTADGVVQMAGGYKGYGKCVIIKHKNGYKTLYGHLSKINVTKGQKIAPGDKIGEVGSTGRSTGPHLHYEVIKNGKRVNPKKYLTMG